jgi:hypothetical protein
VGVRGTSADPACPALTRSDGGLCRIAPLKILNAATLRRGRPNRYGDRRRGRVRRRSQRVMRREIPHRQPDQRQHDQSGDQSSTRAATARIRAGSRSAAARPEPPPPRGAHTATATPAATARHPSFASTLHAFTSSWPLHRVPRVYFGASVFSFTPNPRRDACSGEGRCERSTSVGKLPRWSRAISYL